MFDKTNGAMLRAAYYSSGSSGTQRPAAGSATPVRLATTANIAGTYVAATQKLTVTATGALSVDSVAVAVGDRILLKDQTTGAQKGVYDVLVKGATGVSAVLKRSADWSHTFDFLPGRIVSTSAEGSANASLNYMLTAAASAVLDTNLMPFSLTGTATVSAAAVVTALASAATAVDFNAQAITGAPSVSGASGVTLKRGATSIVDAGVTTSTDVTVLANKNLTFASGTGACDLSAGSGVFKTPTGAGTLSGTTNIAANKDLTCSAGTTAFDLSLGTGVFKTPSGLNTFGGKQAAGASVNLVADPGGANGAIAVTASGVCALTIASAGAETSTLAIPAFVGQRLTIVADTVGTGTRAVTAASAINGAGNTVMTFNAARDQIDLIGITVGGTRAWAVLLNISVSLS